MTKKPKKAKNTGVAKLFANSALRALAVVTMTVGLGGYILPHIFAATTGPATYGVTGVTTRAGNGSGYGMNIDWTGKTPDHYVVTGAGNKISTTNLHASMTGLTCNKQYTFTVYAASANGSQAGSSKSANGTAPCPTATIRSLYQSGSYGFYVSYSNDNFASQYRVEYTNYYSGGHQTQVTPLTSATSQTVNAYTCGVTYYVTVVAYAGGQNGPLSPSYSVAEPDCPAAPPPSYTSTSTSSAPTPAPKPAPTTSTSTAPAPATATAPKTTSTTKRTTTSKGIATVLTPAATPAPSQPTNFAATVASHKIVQLSWDAAANDARYVLNRSVDGVTWTKIADVTDTFYNDDSADFSTTYHYQLQAIGSDGQQADPVTVDVTTEAFTQSSNTVMSDDKKVTITIPDGAIDGEYSCSIGSDADTTNLLPAGQSLVVGPYDLLCITSDGKVITTFTKALPVTVRLGDSANGFNNINVQSKGDKGWSQVAGTTYNQSKQQISFKLTNNKVFGVFGTKHKGSAGIIFLIFFLLLLAGGVVFVVLRRRNSGSNNQYPLTPGPTLDASPTAAVTAAALQPTAEQEFRQAIAQPDCTHLSLARQVIPSSAGCLECEQQGTKWNALRICLICGHVGCSDDSVEQHALKHFQQTGHPLIYEYGNPAGNSIGWCYIDETYI